MGICVLIAVLHIQQRRALARESDEVRRFGQARLDLADGFVHVVSADGPGPPYDRAQGLALLRQAVRSFEEGTHGGAGAGPVRHEFAVEVERFRDRLGEWQGPGRADPRSVVEFRVRYHQLAGQAARADAAAQARLGELTQRQGRVFGGVLGAAGVLLAIVFGFAVLAGRSLRREADARRRAEDRDRRSAELLRAVVGGTTDAMFVKDRNGKYLLFNEAAARFVGKSVAEVLGADDTALFDPESARDVMARDRKIMATGAAETAEEALTADGVTRTYLATKLPYHDGAGTVIGVIGISRDITDRKEAERQLRAERDRFEKLVEAAPAVVCSFLLRPDGSACVPYASTRIESIYGLPPAELARDAAPLVARIHPDDLALVRTTIDESARTLSLWRAEFRVLNPSVGEIWVEGYSAPARLPDGSTLWHGCLVDVTGRKRAEEDARGVRDMLRLILDTVPHGVFWKDRRSRHLGCNAVVARALGFDSPDQVVGRADTDLPSVTPAQAAEFMRVDREVFESGRPRYGVNETLALADGRTIWLDTNKVPLRDAGGRVVGILGTWQDVTDRKRAEEALRQSEARLRAVAEGLADPLYVHDEAGTLLYVNPSAAAALGYTTTELLRLGVCDIDGTFTRRAAPEKWEEHPSRPALRDTFETTHRRKDHTVFPVEIRLSVIPWEGRTVFLASARDLTERKAAEQGVRDREGLLRAVTGAARVGLVVVSERYEYLFANEAYTDVLGLDPGTVLGRRVPDLLPHGWEQIRPRLDRALAGARVEYELALPPVPGASDSRWFRVMYEPGPDRAGRPTVIAALIDISEPRRAESALRTSRARLTAALDSMTDALSISDAGGRFIEFNEAFATFHKFRTKAECPRTLAAYPAVLAVSRADGVPAPLEQWADSRALRGEGGNNVEYRLQRRDTGESWIGSFNFAPIRDEAGAVVGAVVVGRDVTRQKQAEEARAQLAAIVESSNDAIVSKTLDGTIRTWNAGAERLFGYPAAEMIGRSITHLIPASRLNEEDEILARLRLGARVEHFDTVRLARDGRPIDVSLTISPIRNAAGQIVGASKIVHDITGRVRARQRLAVQHAVVSILTDTESLREAAPAILRAVCESTGWDLGALWTRDEAEGVLTLVDVWAGADESLATFCAESRRMTFRFDVGLPGRVWAAGRAVWVADVRAASWFLRNAAARAAGLCGAFGLPIRCGSEVFGVVEFFTRGLRPPDEELLQVFDSLGGQIGQFAERKRAKAALRQSEARFRSVFEYAATGIGITDPAGRFLQGNPAYRAVLGLTEDELRTADLAELIHPDDRDRNMSLLRQLAAGEISGYEIENRFLNKSGTPVWVHKVVSALHDGAGRVTHLIALVTDITGRRQAEAALRESEARLRLAIEVAGLGVVRIDYDSDTVLLSPYAATMFDLPADEPLPRAAVHARFFPADRDEIERRIADNLDPAGDGLLVLDHRITCADGSVRWLSARKQVYFERGGPRRAVLVAADITARRRIEDSLRASETRFRTLIEFLPDAVYVSIDRRLAFCNPACVRLFGAADPTQLHGKSPFDLMHPDDHGAIRARIALIRATGAPVPGREETAVRLDGRTVPVFVTALPITDHGASATLVVLHNLTERKRLELQLRHQELMLREAADLAHVGG
ncbi:PAS domain S-box protein [Frigoriglobus tundricola]|uniref:PAS domain S-box protein n=1 Tax=Frigoriglobus tundricola TaxID=2774151 RepID=UPI00148E91E4|nr:PAS domain S-box protein [Frigoriglobus tundricola]